MKGIVQILPLVAIAGVFWLLLVRPARARQQEAQRVRQDVAVGRRVITTSGLHGTVVGLADDIIELQISPGVVTRWELGAVGRILDDPPGA